MKVEAVKDTCNFVVGDLCPVETKKEEQMVNPI